MIFKILPSLLSFGFAAEPLFNTNQNIPCPTGLTYVHYGCADSDGKIVGPGEYLNGLVYFKDGVKHGEYIESQPPKTKHDGKTLIVKGQYENDLPVGDWHVFPKDYSSSGRYKMSYVDGLLKSITLADKKTIELQSSEPLLTFPSRRRAGYIYPYPVPDFNSPETLYADSSKTKIAGLFLMNYTFLKNLTWGGCGRWDQDSEDFMLDVYERKNGLCQTFLRCGRPERWHEVWLECKNYVSLFEHYKKRHGSISRDTKIYQSPDGKRKIIKAVDEHISVEVLEEKEVSGEIWIKIKMRDYIEESNSVKELGEGWIPMYLDNQENIIYLNC